MPRVFFRFQLVPATVGAAVMSVATGLFAFLPGTRDFTGPVFGVGALLTANGFVMIAKHGAVVHQQWSLDVILKALDCAPERATIQILQTWFPEEDFIKRLEHFYRFEGKRFHLRVMLMNPHEPGVIDVLAARVKLRWIDRAKAASDIMEALDGLVRLKQNVDSAMRQSAGIGNPSETVDLEVRLYDFLPFGPIYKIGDEVIFVGFYLSHTSSVHGPMIEVRKERCPDLWHVFEEDLRCGWEDAVPYHPSINARQG